VGSPLIRKTDALLVVLFLALAYYVMPSSAVSVDASELVARSNPLQTPLQFNLEGMTRMPMVGMTQGSLGGWNENDWIPFRLMAENGGGNDATFEAAIEMEYQNNGRIGIDAFSDCFSASSPGCGSGMSPMMGSMATGTGHMWSLTLGSSTGQAPEVSFSEEPGGVQTIRWAVRSVTVPAHSSLSITWAVHLAKGGSTNLACAQDSPLSGCAPANVPGGMGEASWPGRSLQIRAASPSIPGERTVSIDVAQQGQQTQQGQPSCVIATAAYGSEMAAPVQFLREFRDKEVESTYLGSEFLTAFNSWYYSWAPGVAGAESTSPQLRSLARLIIVPLLGILFLSKDVFQAIRPINSEGAILTSGLIASGLLGLIYMTPFVALFTKLGNLRIRKRTLFQLSLVCFALTLSATIPYRVTGPIQMLTVFAVVESALLAPTLLIMSSQRLGHWT
jgi:hypothetical protein